MAGVLSLKDIINRYKNNPKVELFFGPEFKIIPWFLLSQKETLKANKFENYKLILQYGAKPGSIAFALRYDDVDLLQKLTAEIENFDYSRDISLSYFDGFGNYQNICLTAYAAAFNAIKCFKFLLLNEAPVTGATATLATVSGSNEILRICEQKETDFQCCLNAAVMYHQHEIFDWLLMHHPEGGSDWFTAVYSYNLRVMSFLKANKEDTRLDSTFEIMLQGHLAGLTMEINERRSTSVTAAVATGNIPLLNKLMKNGLSILENPNLLLYAALNGDIRMIEFLIDHGVSVNVRNNQKFTPLMAALQNGQEAAAAVLVARGAQLFAENIAYLRPIHFAAMSGCVDVIRFLIESGDKVFVRSLSVPSPLNVAATHGSEPGLQVLLDEADRCGCLRRELDRSYSRTSIFAGAEPSFGFSDTSQITVPHSEISDFGTGFSGFGSAKTPLDRLVLRIPPSNTSYGGFGGFGGFGRMSSRQQTLSGIGIDGEGISGFGASKSAPTYEGTPLECAEREGMIECKRILKARGAKPSLRPPTNRPPMNSLTKKLYF